MNATCNVRMWGDEDGLLCDAEHHPAHTFSAASQPDWHDAEVCDD